MPKRTIDDPKVVSREEWLVARRELLAREKQLTREHDKVREQRLQLPWVKIEKNYVFDGPNGKESLADLFQGRSQLVVRHFMFGPEWQEGCFGCSFASDHVDGALVHLENKDITYAAVSRAPYPAIAAFRQRMGWNFHWVSSFASDFNYDFHASLSPEEIAQGKAEFNFELRDSNPQGEEMSGLSVFYKNPSGEIFHTYSCYARGDEGGVTTYFYVDLTPKGRDENGPTFCLADWVRHHDRYGTPQPSAPAANLIQLDAAAKKA
ncbi:MAG TPA: thioredoxin family protein [Dongiaceae bacterium]|nr:thioredoxin family protein [Dongiaceae bacterium]